MALSLAAAALGSAVIGGAASAYGASQSKKAANKALDAQNAASQQQLAAQQAALDRITGLNEPFRQGGLSAFDALLAEYGLAPTSGAPAPTGGAPATYGGKTPGGFAGVSPQEPTPDYKAYLAANPDVQANYEQTASTPEGQAYLQSLADLTPGGPEEDLAAAHYQSFGQKEGRALPTVAQQPAPATAPDLRNAPRPEGGAPPTYTRPMGQTAPDLASYFSNFQESPGFKFALQQGLDSINAASAARGKLRSGDAAKALQDRGNGLASQDYGNWFQRQLQQAQLANQQYQFDANRGDNNFNNDRAYGTSLWQNQRDFGNTNFNTDRQYQTNRDDTRTSNLFSLANAGLQAAGNVGGAASNYANNASSIFGSQANAASDAAYSRALANNQLVGGLANAGSNLFASWGGSYGVPRPSYTGVQPFDPINGLF